MKAVVTINLTIYGITMAVPVQ